MCVYMYIILFIKYSRETRGTDPQKARVFLLMFPHCNIMYKYMSTHTRSQQNAKSGDGAGGPDAPGRGPAAARCFVHI